MPKIYQEAEKYIHGIYWSETHNKDNKLNIETVVNERLIKDNKEKDPEYYDHRPGVVHVSSLAKCLRGVVHEMLGAQKTNEIDTRKLGIFKAGNLFEDFIVDALGGKMLDRQTEYVFKYKNLIITGRDDGTVEHDGVRAVLENKSVHTDSFWYRKKEGTLVASHNQMQLETYLWLRRILPDVYKIGDDVIYTNLGFDELRIYKKDLEISGSTSVQKLLKPDNSNLHGIFCYISKDDCIISQAPVKFNRNIIDECVTPVLDLISEAYENKDPMLVPAPSLVAYSESKNQYQVNWLCKYCDYHEHCAGKGWSLEASNEVTRLNKDLKNTLFNKFANKPKPIIGVDPGHPAGDSEAIITGEQKPDGEITITSIEIK